MDQQQLAEIQEQHKRHKVRVELLNGIIEDLEDKIDDEIDEWVDLRTKIINSYPDDDIEALLNMRPGSPRELLESTIDIIGEDPPVVVIENLLYWYEFDNDAIEQLKSADDIYFPKIPPRHYPIIRVVTYD